MHTSCSPLERLQIICVIVLMGAKHLCLGPFRPWPDITCSHELMLMYCTRTQVVGFIVFALKVNGVVNKCVLSAEDYPSQCYVARNNAWMRFWGSEVQSWNEYIILCAAVPLYMYTI